MMHDDSVKLNARRLMLQERKREENLENIALHK